MKINISNKNMPTVMFIAFLIMLSNSLFAQQDVVENFTAIDTITVFDPETNKEVVSYVNTELEVHSHPDEMPFMSNCISKEYVDKAKCSQQKLQEFISKFLDYPEEAKAKALQGIVEVQFIINEDGAIQFVSVKKSDNPALNDAATNVIQNMNKYFSEDPWVPGFHQGNRVATKMVVPVQFKL